MDKFVSILAFPVGLLICFGPIIVVWLKMELTEPSEDSPKNHK